MILAKFPEYSTYAGTLQWSMKSKKEVHIKYFDERS